MESGGCCDLVRIQPPSEAEIADGNLGLHFSHPKIVNDAKAKAEVYRWIHGPSSGSESDDAGDGSGRCRGCDMHEYDVVLQYYKNEEASEKFFIAHGIYPSRETMAKCEKCGFLFGFDPALHPRPGWSCKRIQRWVRPSRRSQRVMDRCPTYNKHISMRTGAFMGKSNLPTWKLLMMALLHLQRDNRHHRSQVNLNVAVGTSSKYRKCFQKATLGWIEEQEPIGGKYPAGSPIIVELDETLFISTKHKKNNTEAIWVLGGIERHSKKRFLLPLSKVVESRTGAKRWCSTLLRDEDTLIPLIKKYVKPGSMIVTDGWTAYLNLDKHGFVHERVIHGREWVVPERPHVHTQTIERLWGHLKGICCARGQRKEYLKEILGRYVFLCTFSEERALHELLILLAKKHKHPLVSFE